MNRQERRKHAKAGIDHKLLKQIQDQAKHEAVNTTTNYAVACAVLVLRDKFGFGEIRAKRFMQAYVDMFADVTSGRIRFDDVLEVIERELKIQIGVE